MMLNVTSVAARLHKRFHILVQYQRNYSNFSDAKQHDRIKRFKPSIDSTANVVEEKVSKPMYGMLDVMRHQRKEKQDAPTLKALNWFDKKLLVALGKFKSTDEVPDKILYKAVDLKALKKEKKSLIQESGFRYVMTADYMLTFLCVCFLCAMYYSYSTLSNNNINNQETVDKL